MMQETAAGTDPTRVLGCCAMRIEAHGVTGAHQRRLSSSSSRPACAVPLLVTRDDGRTDSCVPKHPKQFDIDEDQKGLRLCRIGPVRCPRAGRFLFFVLVVMRVSCLFRWGFKPTQTTYRPGFSWTWHRKYVIFKPFTVLVNRPFGSIRGIRHVFFSASFI